MVNLLIREVIDKYPDNEYFFFDLFADNDTPGQEKNSEKQQPF